MTDTWGIPPEVGLHTHAFTYVHKPEHIYVFPHSWEHVLTHTSHRRIACPGDGIERHVLEKSGWIATASAKRVVNEQSLPGESLQEFGGPASKSDFFFLRILLASDYQTEESEKIIIYDLWCAIFVNILWGMWSLWFKGKKRLGPFKDTGRGPLCNNGTLSVWQFVCCRYVRVEPHKPHSCVFTEETSLWIASLCAVF